MSDEDLKQFEKLAAGEDADGNGLVRHPSVRWLLWVTDAATVFVRGLLNGLFPGLGGGGIAMAITDSTNPQTLAANGALGFATGLLFKGLERLHVWQLQPENEMPNPFRAPPLPFRPTPMVPKKDAERVTEPTPPPAEKTEPFGKLPTP